MNTSRYNRQLLYLRNRMRTNPNYSFIEESSAHPYESKFKIKNNSNNLNILTLAKEKNNDLAIYIANKLKDEHQIETIDQLKKYIIDEKRKNRDVSILIKFYKVLIKY